MELSSHAFWHTENHGEFLRKSPLRRAEVGLEPAELPIASVGTLKDEMSISSHFYC